MSLSDYQWPEPSDNDDGEVVDLGRKVETIQLPNKTFSFIGYFMGDAKRHAGTGEWRLEVRIPHEYRRTLSRVLLENSQQNLVFTVRPWDRDHDVLPESEE